MKVLIATVNYILFADLKTREVKILEGHRKEYYGISWWEDSPYPLLSHSAVENDTILSFDTFVNAIKGYVSLDKKQSTPFLLLPHQLVCAPDHKIIITNTGKNCITVYDDNTGFYKDVRIDDVIWDRVGGYHFNSVYLKDNKLYLLAHGNLKNSFLVEFSYPECEILNQYHFTNRSHLHNIWVTDANEMFSCNSEAGELIELKTNEAVWKGGAFYPRGLAATNDIILIGDSEILPRSHRMSSQTGIWLVDRKTLTTLDYFALGPYGAVHEVRILDVPDEAHHGIPFKNIQALEERNFLHERQAQKIKLSKQLKNTDDKLSQFIHVKGHLIVTDEGWIEPYSDYLVIATTREKYNQAFTVLLDYNFCAEKNLHEQHLSVVVGYKGMIYDENMIAVLLHYVRPDLCSLELWQNNSGDWKLLKSLQTNISAQGKLRVTRRKNHLEMAHNNKLVSHEFNSEELEGAVGLRCLGSQFKNFQVTAA